MHISRIDMMNFHGFINQTYSFSKRFSVLIGENGTGKTSILDGVSVGLGAFLRGIIGSDTGGRTIHENEIHLKMFQHSAHSVNYEAQYPCKVTTSATLHNRDFIWTRSVDRMKGNTTRVEAKEIISYAEELNRQVQSGEEIILPVISYFGTGRVWARKKDKTVNPWSGFSLKWLLRLFRRAIQ